MKKVSKTLAIVLCLVMILSLTALADWTVFGKTNSHNHVVTSAPTSSSPSISEIKLMNAGGGWDGVDTEPLIRTVTEDNESITYAYVLYDAHAAGGHLAKINCSAATPYTVWDHQISGSSGFQLSTPLLVEGTQPDGSDDVIYLASSLSDKYVLTNYYPTLPVTGVSSQTVTADIANLETASNRVAMGIKLSSSSVTGDAYVDLGYGTPLHLTLTANGSNSGTSYKPYEVEVHDPDTGALTGYEYYWYINHNVTGTANSSATVTVSVTLTGGTGDIQYLDVYANKSSVQKVTGLYATAANAATVVKNTTICGNVDGQINTPITTDGTNIYFGTYTGVSTSGTYYQLNLTPTLGNNNEEIYSYEVCTPSSVGYYWAGAACDSLRVYFGSDDGKIYWRSLDFFNDDTEGGSLDLINSSLGATDAGKVRSTIMIDGGKLYFTSQGGYLWCCSFENGALKIDWKVAIRNSGNTANVTCTSTPTKVGNRIYVGCYGGTGKAGVKCIDISGNTPQQAYVVQNNYWPVQCSIVVKSTGTNIDYLYFVTNANTPYGMAYCYSWNGSTASSVWTSATATPTWDTTDHGLDRTFALGGISIDNSIAVYGNDHNYVYIVK